MKRNFNVQYNVGRARYCVNFHDGEKTHNDGSPFFDLEICSNKRELSQFVKGLRSQGYSEMTFPKVARN